MNIWDQIRKTKKGTPTEYFEEIQISDDRILREWDKDSNSAEFRLLKSHMMTYQKPRGCPAFSAEQFTEAVIHMTKSGELKIALVKGEGIVLTRLL